MANETATKSKRFYCVSLVPDICKTPIGPARPPIPYSIIGEFAEATDVSPNVKSLSEPVILFQRSTIPTVKGDEPGTAGGIKSGTYGKRVETKTASATLRANGTATVQEGCEVWMNNRNTIGKIYERGGAPPRTRLQQIEAWLGEQAAAATESARQAIKPLAQQYKDQASDSLHQFAADAMDAGASVAGKSAALGGAGMVVAATGMGAPIAAVMEGGAAAGGAIGAGVMGVGGAVDASAKVLDQAADFVLTGKTPEVLQAAVDLGARLIEGAATARLGGVSQWLVKQFPSLGKLLKDKPAPGKKSVKPPPPKPPDKPRGGKTKGNKKESKSDKPSECCPRSTAPGGKPVSGRKPVHFGTGEEVLHQTDFVLDGPQPIAWTRCYRSGSEHEDWSLLGARWASPFTSSLLLATNGIVYVDDSGRGLRLPPLAIGQSFDNRQEGFTLSHSSADEFILVWHDGSRETFTSDASARECWLPHGYNGINAMRKPDPTMRAQRFTLRRMAGRDGHGISVECFRDAEPGGVLLRVTSDDGQIIEAIRAGKSDASISAGARIGRVDEIRPDGTRICHVRYAYEAEAAPSEPGLADDFARLPVRFNLVRQTNAADHVRRYTYCHHLLQTFTTYGGYTYKLSWISLAALYERWSGSLLDERELRDRFPVALANSYQARAIASAGEDGSDDLRIDYPSPDTTRVTDATGAVLEYTFDTNWLATEVHRVTRDGAISLGRRDWDRDGMLLAEIDAAGHATRYTYDAAGNLSSSTDALGRTGTIEYGKHNLPVALTDPAGHVTKLDYDTAGRLTAYTDALGYVTSYRYDTRGRVTEVQDAKGGVKQLEYDRTGRLIAYTDCSGNRSRYRYDKANRISLAIDPLNQETRYDYDNLGRLQCLTQPDKSKETFTYDADGNLLTHTDARGFRTDYAYNGLGLPISRTDALGQTLRYGYDAALRLVELVNANGESYRLDYNAEGRLIGEIGFDGKTTSYRYDRAGQLVASDCHGQRIELLRDICGQLLARQSTDGVTRFAHDVLGRLVAVATPHAEQRFAYDALGRLLEERGAYFLTPKGGMPELVGRTPDASFIMTHAYDELGNRIQSVLPNGRRVDIQRYGAGHWHGTLWQGEPVVAIERDALHRERLRRLGASQQPLQAERSYDPQSRLTAMTLRRGADAQTRPLRERHFRYDPVGNLLAIEHGWHTSNDTLGTFRYAYDPIGQLLSAVQPGLTETFAFDPAGNLVDLPTADEAPGTSAPANAPSSTVLAHVTHNLLKSYQGHSYRYDEQGNVVNKHSAQGGAVGAGPGQNLDLVYDSENRLIRATRTTGTVRHTSCYRYDAFSRRIAKHVIKETWANGQSCDIDAPVRSDEHSVIFVWDGDTLAQELRPAGTVTYLYEPDSFVPLARIESAGERMEEQSAAKIGWHGMPVDRFVHLWRVAQWELPSERVSAGESERELRAETECAAAWLRCKTGADGAAKNDHIDYYNCDHLGTPRELVDSAGKVIWQARLKAWGRKFDGHIAYDRNLSSNIAEIEQPFRFQGQYEDRETGLHYNRYRYFDPDAARFTSQDPIGLLGGVNGYQYAQNPTKWVDPFGLSKCAKNSPCNPCVGKNPSVEAMATQGTKTDPSNPYYQVDFFEDKVLKAGTILYSLSPGGAPGFGVTNHTLIKSKGDVIKYHDLTQVTPGFDIGGNPRQMRNKVQVYRVNEDICVAKGIAKKNSQFGLGGATQYYVSISDVNKLTPGKIRPI